MLNVLRMKSTTEALRTVFSGKKGYRACAVECAALRVRATSCSGQTCCKPEGETTTDDVTTVI